MLLLLLLLLGGDTVYLDVGGAHRMTTFTADGGATVGMAGEDRGRAALSSGSGLMLLLLYSL